MVFLQRFRLHNDLKEALSKDGGGQEGEGMGGKEGEDEIPNQC